MVRVISTAALGREASLAFDVIGTDLYSDWCRDQQPTEILEVSHPDEIALEENLIQVTPKVTFIIGE